MSLPDAGTHRNLHLGIDPTRAQPNLHMHIQHIHTYYVTNYIPK